MSKEITKRIDFLDSEAIFDLFDCRCTNLSRKCVDQVLMCDYFNKTLKECSCIYNEYKKSMRRADALCFNDVDELYCSHS